MQAGLDSLGAVELRDAIERGFGVSLPATAVFDHPTVSQLAAFIGHMQLLGRPAQKDIRSLQAYDALGPTESASVLPRLRTMLADILGMPVADDQPLMEVHTPNVSEVLPAEMPFACHWHACVSGHAPHTTRLLCTDMCAVTGKAGLDSLGALELHGAIADAFAVHLPATAAFDFPSLAALAARISQLAQPVPAEPHAVRAGVDALSAAPRMQCYVLGIGCRFPGNTSRTGTVCSAARASLLTGTAAPASEPCRARAPGYPAFCNTFQWQTSLQAQAPLQRWDVDAHYDPSGAPGKAYMMAAAFCQARARAGRDDVACRAAPARETTRGQPRCRMWTSMTPSPSATGEPRRWPWTRRRACCCRCSRHVRRSLMHMLMLMLRERSLSGYSHAQVTAEVLGAADVQAMGQPGWARHAGTYVGSMFTDYGTPASALAAALDHHAPLPAAQGGLTRWVSDSVPCRAAGALLRDAYGVGSTAAVMTGVGAPYQGGRLAYTFDLQGPCNNIDTACSSSLVAAHNAHHGTPVALLAHVRQLRMHPSHLS